MRKRTIFSAAFSLALLATAACVGPSQSMDGGQQPTKDQATVVEDMQKPPDGGGVLGQRWLTLPFQRGTAFKITEGAYYTPEEKAIHGLTTHMAVDFAPDSGIGTPIVAAHSGWAVAFFHVSPSKRNVTLPNGKHCDVIGNGFGHGVQIWSPTYKTAIGYGHMRNVVAKIPQLKSTLREESGLKYWDPLELYVDPATLTEGKAVWVERGEIIGYVGNSGLTCDLEEDFDTDPEVLLAHAWDDFHLHLDAARRGLDGTKTGVGGMRWDTFDLYGQAPLYAALKQGPFGMWIETAEGTPAYPEDLKK